ncbi:MAG: hypothetical protein JW712_08850 [Dehalococcoidales bacterium]|nr:hypothetical protein [Dehalococcoidales bacterium]
MSNILSDIEYEFLLEVEKNGGALYHDYSNPLHYEYALSVLGGKSHLKKNHSTIFNLFEKTKENHIQANKNGVKLHEQNEDGFSDSMKVRAIYFDDKNLISDISADHTKTRPSMAITAKIVDKTNERIEATVQNWGDEIYSLLAEMEKQTSELVHSDDREFETIADFWWLDDQNTVSTNGYTRKMRDFKVIGRNSIVENFVVNGPRVIKTPSRDHVVVVYNRSAQVGEDYDYSYDNSPQGNKIDIYLPASATITLNPDWTILGLNRDMGFKLEIEDLNKGVVNYYGQGGFDSIQTAINKNVITFTFQDTRYPADPKFKEFWNNALDISNFHAKTTVDIYCQVELDIKNSAGLQIHIPVVFQSINPQSGDKSIATSKKIMIQWGCVGKDTLIPMSDNTYKEISKINVGDVVRDELGESVSVVDTYSGHEDTITLLETSKQKKVLLTSGHPVSTKRGLIPVSALNAGDEIKTVDGFEVIKDLRTVDYNEKAYSLKFDDPHLIPCNGIICGDFAMQQETLAPSAVNTAPVPVRSEECRKAKAGFHQLFKEIAARR